MVHYIKKYRYILLIGCLVIIGVVVINKEPTHILEVEQAVNSEVSSSHEDKIIVDETEDPTENNVIDIAVDIKGAILDPGVYHLHESARIYDVIELAGGFLEEADVKQINLAQRIHDEMLIYVPRQGEEHVAVPVTNSSPDGNKSDAVRINVATMEELQTLTGIGPSKAQAILDYIEENGPLTQLEELLQINGIGDKTLEKFKDNVIIP